MTTEPTCYICDPENPQAEDEGCAKCEAAWWSYYFAVMGAS